MVCPLTVVATFVAHRTLQAKSNRTLVVPTLPIAKRKPVVSDLIHPRLNLRTSLWLSGYVEDKPLVTHVKTLNAARKAAIAANSNFLTTAVRAGTLVRSLSKANNSRCLQVKFPSSGSESTLAISKPPMLTLLTNGGSSSSPKWTVSDAGFQANEELVDVLTCNKVTADDKGGVTVQGSGGNPQVLMPTSALSSAGTACSNLATTSEQKSSARGWVDGTADSLPVIVALVLAVWAAQSSLVL